MRRSFAFSTAIGLVLACQQSAQAADPASPDLTVQPWTDSTFQLSEKEKRLTLRYHTVTAHGLLLYSSASVPLDTSTREAAFVQADRLPAFSARLLLGYDSRVERLKRVARVLESLEVLDDAPSILALREYLNAKLISDVDKAICKKTELGQNTPWICEGANLNSFLSSYTCARFGHVGKTDALQCVVTPSPGNGSFACENSASGDPGNLTSGDVCNDLFKHLSWRARKQKFGESAAYDNLQLAGPHILAEVRQWQIAHKVPISISEQEAAQEVVSNPELRKHLRDKVKTAEKENLSTLGLVGYDGRQESTQWSLAGDLAVQFDRLSIYQNDLTNQIDATTYRVQLGALASVFLRSATTLMLRGGWDGGVRMSPTTIERCQQYASNDPMVSGKSCDPAALYLKGDLPGFSHSGYLRFAAMQLFPQLRRDHIIPGLELRLGLEGLGDSLRVNGRLAGILTPVIGSAAIRGGIALDVTYDPSATADSGAWTLVPMAFLGATIDQYMGLRPTG